MGDTKMKNRCSTWAPNKPSKMLKKLKGNPKNDSKENCKLKTPAARNQTLLPTRKITSASDYTPKTQRNSNYKKCQLMTRSPFRSLFSTMNMNKKNWSTYWKRVRLWSLHATRHESLIQRVIGRKGNKTIPNDLNTSRGIWLKTEKIFTKSM